jgi:hypothetical protein
VPDNWINFQKTAFQQRTIEVTGRKEKITMTTAGISGGRTLVTKIIKSDVYFCYSLQDGCLVLKVKCLVWRKPAYIYNFL